MSDWKNAEEWRDAWHSFLSDARLSRLALLLDAPSCREAWLQAEAHSHFRADPALHFYCNTAEVAGGKADFAEYTSHTRDARLRFLGELKWLGADYQSKVLTGQQSGVRMLSEAHPGTASVRLSSASETEPYYRDRGWSLLHDYFRLLHAPHLEAGTVRFLITILDLRAETELGNLLSRVEFEGPPILDVPIVEGVRARIWNVTGGQRG